MYEKIFQINDNYAIIQNAQSELLYNYEGINSGNGLFTIAIPTYRRKEFFFEAFDSALKQNYDGPYEIIIVDNDDLRVELNDKINHVKETINSLNLSFVKISYYWNQKNIGVNNFNRCMELANTKYVGLLHDDDMLLPSYLSEMYHVIKKADADAIGCSLCVIDREGNRKERFAFFKNVWRNRAIRFYEYDFFIDRGVMFPGFMLKKDVAIASGGIDKNWGPCTDYVWQWNVAKRFKVFNVCAATYLYRVADNDSTRYDTQLELCKMSCRLMRQYYIDKKNKIPKWLYKTHASCYLKMLIDNANNIWSIKINHEQLLQEFSLFNPNFVIYNLWRIIRKTYGLYKGIFNVI